MTDEQKTQPESEAPKKVSLADAIKNKLAQKKAEQSAQKGSKSHANNSGPGMKSQMTKKVNNQRRRTGGS